MRPQHVRRDGDGSLGDRSGDNVTDSAANADLEIDDEIGQNEDGVVVHAVAMWRLMQAAVLSPMSINITSATPAVVAACVAAIQC